MEAVPQVEEGQACLITGETTGVMEVTLTDIRDTHGKPAQTIQKGQFFSLKTDGIVRRGDKLYLWTE